MGSAKYLIHSLRPVIGGYLNQGLGWRSIFWFLVIFSFCLLCGLFFLLPETFRPASVPQQLPVVGKNSEKQDSSASSPKHHNRRVNPLQALELLKFPNMQFVIGFVAFT
jgi:MFS family permease